MASKFEAKLELLQTLNELRRDMAVLVLHCEGLDMAKKIGFNANAAAINRFTMSRARLARAERQLRELIEMEPAAPPICDPTPARKGWPKPERRGR